MAKKQKSFADKASGKKKTESVYVKYVKSVQSEKTGRWRFNEQMLRLNKGEQLDAALKRMDEVANLIDIDLSEFVKSDDHKEKEAPEAVAETIYKNYGTTVSPDNILITPGGKPNFFCFINIWRT